jgi:hypothetical protein
MSRLQGRTRRHYQGVLDIGFDDVEGLVGSMGSVVDMFDDDG